MASSSDGTAAGAAASASAAAVVAASDTPQPAPAPPRTLLGACGVKRARDRPDHLKVYNAPLPHSLTRSPESLIQLYTAVMSPALKALFQQQAKPIARLLRCMDAASRDEERDQYAQRELETTQKTRARIEAYMETKKVPIEIWCFE
jgi:Spy/CpxP family protein refolding chaperone